VTSAFGGQRSDPAELRVLGDVPIAQQISRVEVVFSRVAVGVASGAQDWHKAL
jgi:hypothetical protein